MGKRKKSSRKPNGPKKNEPLPTVFNCLFCNHEKSVNVKIEKKLGYGSLECKVCGQRFSTPVNYLSAAVDVYADWVDAAGKPNLPTRPRDGHDLIHGHMSHALHAKKATDEYIELAAQSGEGPALGSLEDPRARASARKNRGDEEDADNSDGGDPENPRYTGSDIVADDDDE